MWTDDGDPCTTEECVAGTCLSEPKDCDDDDPCTWDRCDPETGVCLNTHEPDEDEDGVADDCDNCPDVYNPDQADTDDDGVGDACECAERRFGGGFCVKGVRFTGGGEVTLKRRNADWSTDLYDDNGSIVIGDPVWTDPNCTGSPAKNEPICFKRGSRPQLAVTLRTDCEERPIVVRAVNATWNMEWRGSAIVKGRTLMVALGVPIGDRALPNQVLVQNAFTLSWSYSDDGGQSFRNIRQTTHTLFIPFAEASGSRPAKRMHWVCSTSAGATTGVECARKMQHELKNHFSLNANYQDNPWYVLDGHDADCETLSFLLKSALQHHGLSGANVMYVYASRDASCTSASRTAWERNRCSVHGDEILCLWLPAFNHWVACCVYNGLWFPGGTDWERSSGLPVLQEYVCPCVPGQEKQWWTWGAPENPHKCTASVPCGPCPP